MAKSINKVTLLGNVGQDPEYKVIPSGAGVCNFTIATTESFKNSNDDWEDRTEWHNIVCWRGLADIANKYIKKGSKIYIEGKLKTETYEKEGVIRYTTRIIASELILLSSREQGSGFSSDSAPMPKSTANKKQSKPIDESDSYNADLESESWDDVPF